ncbi:hypothetical protein [Streptomyces sp. NPDC056670]|uniref:hypothetical protein n=1 Tax=Streptomyces sp. NPDC056670 TaxID=3345904 RepID=UPI0036B5DE65
MSKPLEPAMKGMVKSVLGVVLLVVLVLRGAVCRVDVERVLKRRGTYKRPDSVNLS